jgi:hypothetical protein
MSRKLENKVAVITEPAVTVESASPRPNGSWPRADTSLLQGAVSRSSMLR